MVAKVVMLLVALNVCSCDTLLRSWSSLRRAAAAAVAETVRSAVGWGKGRGSRTQEKQLQEVGEEEKRGAPRKEHHSQIKTFQKGQMRHALFAPADADAEAAAHEKAEDRL